ncbi:SIMPL domain-containing protein [Novosphingobium sp.]|uniref:SIMPL domain-containing protein n=1 Tax=Novosphingobium sp. TaxID=1874826 RepID=UPI0025EF0F99|nr:SIMPL domain-containing protein [Novosphingobium sp.]
MIRRFALCAALPLVALSACGRGDDRPNPRGVDRDETLLSLSAMGEAETVPDLATIMIGVETFGPDAKAANTANSKKAAEIVAALAKFGVGDRDVQTANLSLGRVDYGPRKGQFQASNTLTVRLRDVPRAGEALAAATAAGANVIQGPALRIDDPEKANRGAYIAAYNAARTRAEAYAEAAGMTISRVLTIRDGGQMGGGYPMPMEAAADAAAVMAPPPIAAPAPPPPSIRPGTTRTRVTVQVDFALQAK